MRIFCFFGFHLWIVDLGSVRIERVNKWEVYEHGTGLCARCGLIHEVRREIW